MHARELRPCGTPRPRGTNPGQKESALGSTISATQYGGSSTRANTEGASNGAHPAIADDVVDLLGNVLVSEGWQVAQGLEVPAENSGVSQTAAYDSPPRIQGPWAAVSDRVMRRQVAARQQPLRKARTARLQLRKTERNLNRQTAGECFRSDQRLQPTGPLKGLNTKPPCRWRSSKYKGRAERSASGNHAPLLTKRRRALCKPKRIEELTCCSRAAKPSSGGS